MDYNQYKCWRRDFSSDDYNAFVIADTLNTLTHGQAKDLNALIKDLFSHYGGTLEIAILDGIRNGYFLNRYPIK